MKILYMIAMFTWNGAPMEDHWAGQWAYPTKQACEEDRREIRADNGRLVCMVFEESGT